MAAKLSRKGFADPDIEAELDRLAGERLQDDRRFTEAYVRYRIGRGYGPVRIRTELRERGIDSALADSVFETLDIDWIARVEAAWRKKFDNPAANFREHAKQARFLQYRGFTADQISRVLTSDF